MKPLTEVQLFENLVHDLRPDMSVPEAGALARQLAHDVPGDIEAIRSAARERTAEGGSETH